MLSCQILYKSCIYKYLLRPQNNPQRELLLLSIPILHMRLLGQGMVKKHAGLVSGQARVRAKESGDVCAVRKSGGLHTIPPSPTCDFLDRCRKARLCHRWIKCTIIAMSALVAGPKYGWKLPSLEQKALPVSRLAAGDSASPTSNFRPLFCLPLSNTNCDVPKGDPRWICKTSCQVLSSPSIPWWSKVGV